MRLEPETVIHNKEPSLFVLPELICDWNDLMTSWFNDLDMIHDMIGWLWAILNTSNSKFPPLKHLSQARKAGFRDPARRRCRSADDPTPMAGFVLSHLCPSQNDQNYGKQKMFETFWNHRSENVFRGVLSCLTKRLGLKCLLRKKCCIKVPLSLYLYIYIITIKSLILWLTTVIHMARFMQLKLFNFQVPRSCELESLVFCLSQLQDVVQSSSWTTNLGSLAVQWLTTAIYCHLLPSIAIYCHLLPSIAIYCHLLPSIAIYCHRKNQKLHRRMRNPWTSQLSQWLEDEKLGEASPSLDTRGYFDDWPNKHR